MHRLRLTYLLIPALLILAFSPALFAQISFSITVAPPPIPVYTQPVCPDPDYMWTPGYWAWDEDGYYWVPGTWVPVPQPGLLWTPGYWGWDNGYYVWHDGYWAPQVGFYGGVDYGYGYFGQGFGGGEWRGNHFFYNAAVMHVDRSRINYVYVNKTVIVNRTNNFVSYNGGPGGIHAAPTPAQLKVTQERHIQRTSEQTRQQTLAAHNPQLFAKNNRGKPAVAATVKPGDFSPKYVVPAKAPGGKVNPETLKASAKSMPPPAKTATHPGKATPGAPQPARPNAATPHPPPAPRTTGHPEATGHPGHPETTGHPAPTPPKPSARAPESGSNRTPAARPAPTPPSHAEAPHAATPPHAHAPAPRESAPHNPAPAPREPAPHNPAPAPREPAPHAQAAPAHEHAQAPKPSAPAPHAPPPHAQAPHQQSAPPPHPENGNEKERH